MFMTTEEYLKLPVSVRIIIDALDVASPPPPTAEDVEALPE